MSDCCSDDIPELCCDALEPISVVWKVSDGDVTLSSGEIPMGQIQGDAMAFAFNRAMKSPPVLEALRSGKVPGFG